MIKSMPLSIVITLVMGLSNQAQARTSLKECAISITPEIQQQLFDEHIRFGLPSFDNVDIRHSYAMAFDDVHNIPKWTAWHAIKEYQDTPIGSKNKKRYGAWGAFRGDSVFTHASLNDYKGWYKKEDIIRGHLTPYFISGGDRDNDGLDAEIEGSNDEEDAFDACAVYEVNSMANITPQYHHSFNGVGGAWFTLEADVRKILKSGQDLNIIAGSVFLDEDINYIGNLKDAYSTWDIAIPHGFYKIILDNNQNKAFAFLFGHDRHIPNGCDTRSETGETIKHQPSDCITSIGNIEALTGMKFFPNLHPVEKENIFINSTKLGWGAYRKSL